MDYTKIAAAVIENVGGKSNIKSVAHCATRLRLQLRDNNLRDEEAIANIDGVKGVFLTQSQFQIIFGAGTVNLVCEEAQLLLCPTDQEKDDEEAPTGNVAQRFVKMLSDIFVPIIPAIVAGGLLMGINNLLTSPLLDGQSVIDMFPSARGPAAAINLFASAPFAFLPVLIGFSATKKFGGNPYLGAAMGMIMVHPDLLNAYLIGVAQPPTWDILGIAVKAIGYQGTVLPVLVISYFLASIEKRLHRCTPSWLDNLTTPLIAILLSAFLTFLFVGPVMREAGNWLAIAITWTYHTLGPIGGALFGLAYAPITLTGMHHSFIAIEMQLIADSVRTGGSFIFSTASVNNVAQGAAVLAVLLVTKNEKMKSICSAAGISALLGITEPAMFGVTLKLKYPFYAAIVGSAVGNAYLVWSKTLAQALGAAGLPGFISMKPDHYVDFAIGLILSMSVSFLLTLLLWKRASLTKQEAPQPSVITDAAASAAATTETGDTIELYAPVKGEVISVEHARDAVFASKALGDGIAIDPTEGIVYAPCDGVVNMLFPTKHAVGITADNNLEILIHVGINTVQLNGDGFTAFVAEGDRVRRGDRLLSFDIAQIHEKSYDAQTMMILPNATECTIETLASSAADPSTKAIIVRRA